MTAATMQVTIDPELRRLFRALTDDERTALHESLDAEGCREPLAVWVHKGAAILMDGHNRHEWCIKNGKSFDTFEVPGITTKADAIRWIARNQKGRRNMTVEELSYLRGEQYLLQKQQHGGFQSEGSPSEQTAERIADEESVSRATVERDAEYAEAVDAIEEEAPGAKTALLARKSRGTRAQVKAAAKLPKAKRKEAAEKIAKGAKVKDALPKPKKADPPSDVAKNQAVWKRIVKANADFLVQVTACKLLDGKHILVDEEMVRALVSDGRGVCEPRKVADQFEMSFTALNHLHAAVTVAYSKGKK